MTPAPLHALLYQSTATCACSSSDLARIVASAQVNNAAHDVTGLLLYGNIPRLPNVPGQFMQWLEGPDADVAATFERIHRDSRHTDVRVLARGPASDVAGADRRLFPAWAMSVQRLADLPATLFGFLQHVRSADAVSEGK